MKKRKTPKRSLKPSSPITNSSDQPEKIDENSSKKRTDQITPFTAEVPSEMKTGASTSSTSLDNQKEKEPIVVHRLPPTAPNSEALGPYNQPPINNPTSKLETSPTLEVQSKTTMLFAAFFLGAIGLHRLLMGYKNWWLMLITLGGFGIWALIDFIKIALGKLPMANGVPLEK